MADNPAAKAPPAWYKVSATAAASEFFGSLLFAFFGGLATSQYAAFGNGLALAVCIYICVSVSGGHLNAAVTVATMISGHTPFLQGLVYIVMQAAGMIAGAAITLGLKPAGLTNPGCFGPNGISDAQLWGWEAMMTTLLVSAVLAVAVSQKGAGNIGPFIIGLSLTAAALAGGPYTGAALNPTRVLGASTVYGCDWGNFYIYILAHLTAAVLSAAWALIVAPAGPYFIGRYAFKLGAYVKQGSYFQRSVPWSTAADPLLKYNTLNSADTSLAPYARGLTMRKKAVQAEEGLLPASTPTTTVV
jgi:glycerol uptake facilitator-like aquaporin